MVLDDGIRTHYPPLSSIPRGELALLPDFILDDAGANERAGLPSRQDAHRIAVYRGVEIWHTSKVGIHDYPNWPTGPAEPSFIYRGFDFTALKAVLTTGLDFTGSKAFFGSDSRGKAWEYPAQRETVAVAIFDCARVAPSWAYAGSAVNPKSYARTYLADNGREVCSHFPYRPALTGFEYERQYGHYIPGDPASALVGVLLGSQTDDCRSLLPTIPGIVLDHDKESG